MGKKKILIINKSFVLGGIQIALANMLAQIHDEYEITLAVFNQNGPLKERVLENIRMAKLSPLVEVLGMSKADCKQYGTLLQRFFKIVGTGWAKLFGNTIPVAFALAFQKNLGNFDAVISYHQETSSKTLVTGFGKFALKKTRSPLKIAWVHADFLATKLATEANLKTYRQFDKIVCVSKTCMERFITAYPSLKEKCDYCYNCVPAQEIIEKSRAEQNVFPREEGDLVLFSACRLSAEKGIIPALENLLPLWKNGERLKWYIAGDGPDKEKLISSIQKNALGDQVILLGYQDNPYPYIREADYLFLPSLFETFSMVVAEAHILGTLVIASDLPVMREVLGAGDILCEGNDFATFIKKAHKYPKIEPTYAQQTRWLSQFERLLKR